MGVGLFSRRLGVISGSLTIGALIDHYCSIPLGLVRCFWPTCTTLSYCQIDSQSRNLPDGGKPGGIWAGSSWFEGNQSHASRLINVSCNGHKSIFFECS